MTAVAKRRGSFSLIACHAIDSNTFEPDWREKPLTLSRIPL